MLAVFSAGTRIYRVFIHHACWSHTYYRSIS